MPVINTDEGIKAKWTTEEEDFVLIKYTLQETAFVAERREVKIGLEPHAQYSRTPEGLGRIYNLVDSPAIGINLDTGNAYLAGPTCTHGWTESPSGLCTCMPKIFPLSIPTRNVARSPGRQSAVPVARVFWTGTGL